MKPFIARLLLTTLIASGTASTTVGGNSSPDTVAISLAQLASHADLVVLAQVRDTDYVYQREFPAEGSAYLKVLIAYKSGHAGDIIEVYEKGLHENECYFPNPTVFEEGRRYLLFLRIDERHPERYRGLAQGCALDVLVDHDLQYVVRLPADGIRFTDPLQGVTREFEFADPYALVDSESLIPSERNQLLDNGWLVARGDGYIYTRGVALTEIRKLMDGADDSESLAGK